MINNVNIYGLEESAKAAGYPMSIDTDNTESDLERIVRLGHAKPGSGHDCALKGIIVQADITAPQYWWPQWQRYHFADIVSSQSKMHKLLDFNLEDQCNEYVDSVILDHIKGMIDNYKEHPTKKFYMRILSNLPMGFNLTARITTNYLQLKTMYNQRRKHKLPEWQNVCNWIETLPLMEKILK